MPAPKKYSDELRARATRMALDAIAAEGQRMAAIRRIAGQLDVHPEALRRANEILKTASAFFAAAELDRKIK